MQIVTDINLQLGQKNVLWKSRINPSMLIMHQYDDFKIKYDIVGNIETFQDIAFKD